MSLKDDSAAFEDWLREQCADIGCEVVEADLEYKHDQMTVDAFVFLRATFFRWAKRIETLLPEYAEAPPVLSVGDTHVENFGTWRDNEGRLVWGVNDFDEAAAIPYPFDLVRLATSIRLARLSGVNDQDAAAAIVKGYAQGLAAPRPTLLDEQETWMREYVGVSDRKREKFWKNCTTFRLPARLRPLLLVSKRACQTECRSQRSLRCIKREWVASDARASWLWPFGAVGTWRVKQRRSCHRPGNGPMPGGRRRRDFSSSRLGNSGRQTHGSMFGVGSSAGD
jgi:hypothetical protein